MIWPYPWEAEKNSNSIIIFWDVFTCERRFVPLDLFGIALKSKKNQIDLPCIFSAKRIRAQSVSRAFHAAALMYFS